ncbi:hypothetical protein ACJ41O_009397 [Fusarium nematophilum]
MARTIQISEPFDWASSGNAMAPGGKSSDTTVTTPSYYHGTRAELDECVDSATNRLEHLRQAMTAVAAKDPVSVDDLDDLVEAARHIVNAATFTVKRFYHDKEEGLRTAQERKYAALEEEGLGCFSRRLKRVWITLRSIGGEGRKMASKKDNLLRKLQDALEKTEMHQFLLMLEGNAPY